MAGGICPKHGTEMNGFGSFSFCNECEAENTQQAEYEKDREAAEKDEYSEDTLPGFGATCTGTSPATCTGTPVINSDKYAWFVFSHQQPCRQKGWQVVRKGKILKLDPPKSYYAQMGAIYRVRLASVPRTQVSKDSYKTSKDCRLYLEQMIYFNDRVLIGEVDHGPVQE
jgi:hypothetical protein